MTNTLHARVAGSGPKWVTATLKLMMTDLQAFMIAERKKLRK